MAKKKSKSRTSSKAEREVESYLRLKNMASFIDVFDKRMNNLEDDVALLLALNVAEPELADKMRASLREAAKQGEEVLDRVNEPEISHEEVLDASSES